MSMRRLKEFICNYRTRFLTILIPSKMRLLKSHLLNLLQVSLNSSTNPDFGKGLLVPEVHTNLIEAAEFQGKPLSFRVPNGIRRQHILTSIFIQLYLLPENGRERHAPEYVHVRRQQIDDATTKDLNDDEDMLDYNKKWRIFCKTFCRFHGRRLDRGFLPAVDH